MNKVKTYGVLLFMFGVLFISVSCTPGVRLSTQWVQTPEVKGTYSLIQYGCNYLNDLETVAILDREGDEYKFEPYAPDFKYEVKKGLSEEAAIEMAMKFVNCNASFSRAQMSSIQAPNGGTIGYEVKPIYSRLIYGIDDAINVDYWLKGGNIIINVSLKPAIERMLQDGGGSHRER